jgi:hypothetical protein
MKVSLDPYRPRKPKGTKMKVKTMAIMPMKTLAKMEKMLDVHPTLDRD